MAAKESKFVSAVMYIHNDEKAVTPFLSMLTEVLKETYSQYELIFVNDASTDGSIAEIYRYFDEREMDGQMVSIVQMSHFQGLEAAMNAGRDLAIGDFVYEFDDIYVDYEASVLTNVYERLLSGYDIVAASSSGRQRLSSKVFYDIYNASSHAQSPIGPETFRLISRRAINRIKTIGSYIPYRKAVYMNCGLKADTMVYQTTISDGRITPHSNRTERTSLALDSFIYFTDVLEKISISVAGVFMAIALGMGIYILVEFIGGSRTVEGWLSTMGFMALGFMGVFLLLTLVLKYLSVLLNLIFKQQRYLIAGVEKIIK